jgi:hypothetical protein
VILDETTSDPFATSQPEYEATPFLQTLQHDLALATGTRHPVSSERLHLALGRILGRPEAELPDLRAKARQRLAQSQLLGQVWKDRAGAH